MNIIGLTGGIASGKSAVAKMLRQMGAFVIDADLLAKEAVAPGSAALMAIEERFGEEYLKDGALDRARLAALIFRDDQARRDLNAIVHPEVARLFVQATQERDETDVVYEVPLLFENGLERMMSTTILVAVSPKTQRERLMARDGLTEDEADARIRAQMPLAEKMAKAEYIIDNDGSLSSTNAQLLAIWREVTAPR